MKINLKTYDGTHFVCAENGGGQELVADRTSPREWETFDVLGNFVFGGSISLRTYDGVHFVCAENGGGRELVANRTEAREWETFKIIGPNGKTDGSPVQDGDKISLLTYDNKHFVCAENGGGRELVANRTEAREWETFSVQSLTRDKFSPVLHGFKFENDGFVNDVVSEIDWRTDALCGGMAYAALDYYFSKMPIPNQPFRPACQTPLRTHIYNRQVDSIASNLDKWTEFELGLGLRDSEFFNWGISHRINELKQFLDNGIPCVLCLMGGSGWGHQVVAYDYSMGRYQGDLGDYVEDFNIYVYDPNNANEMTTIVADRANEVYKRKNGSGGWRTYFVDSKYNAKAPPNLPNPNYPNDNLVYELILEFSTDDVDDLRGGNDNVNLVINLSDGSNQTYPNINLGARWVRNSDEYARVFLQRPMRQEDIRNLIIRTTFGGGISGDNWNMSSLKVYIRGGGFFKLITSVGFKRFTGSDNELVVPITDHPNDNLVYELILDFSTGGDDLRGGNDNVNLVVNLTDGSNQTYPNINSGARWEDYSDKSTRVVLQRPVRQDEIRNLIIRTTFGGGISGDNWNMSSLKVHVRGGGFSRQIKSVGSKRFTGSDNELVVPIT